jgi:hypothetical protein
MWGTLCNAAALAAAVSLLPLVTVAPRTITTPGQQGQSKGKWLRVEIQQEGRTIPIKDHAVTIQRKPFDIILYMPDKSTVLVRAASQPALFDLAKSGKPLGRIFNPAQSGAFTPFNKDEDMMLDDPTVQDSWFYDSSEKDHPFNDVASAPGGFTCRRRISNVFVSNASLPIVKTDFDAMYLVFLTGKSSSDFLSTIEEQRDYLKIAFTGPAAAPSVEAAHPAVFGIAVEQLGSAVPISGREARVRKAPFDLLVDLKGIDGVYVHAAFDDAFFEKARRGEPLGRVFRKYQTMALGRFNEKQLLFMNTEDSHHFWYAAGRTEHDFNGVQPIPGGVQGRRVISSLWVGGQPVLVHRVPQSVLYLVFYAGDLSADTDDEAAQRAHERQREVLKITMQ